MKKLMLYTALLALTIISCEKAEQYTFDELATCYFVEYNIESTGEYLTTSQITNRGWRVVTCGGRQCVRDTSTGDIVSRVQKNAGYRCDGGPCAQYRDICETPRANHNS